MTEEQIQNSKNLDLWMIRPCDIYKSEYNECTTLGSRLHQMFVYGSTSDCNHWHEDYTNCLRWKKYKDLKAAETLVESEKNKRNTRWKLYYANDVWETRKTPPENWNDPLPDYIKQRKSNSTLKDTLDEFNQNQNEETDKPLCTIM